MGCLTGMERSGGRMRAGGWTRLAARIGILNKYPATLGNRRLLRSAALPQKPDVSDRCKAFRNVPWNEPARAGGEQAARIAQPPDRQRMTARASGPED